MHFGASRNHIRLNADGQRASNASAAAEEGTTVPLNTSTDARGGLLGAKFATSIASSRSPSHAEPPMQQQYFADFSSPPPRATTTPYGQQQQQQQQGYRNLYFSGVRARDDGPALFGSGGGRRSSSAGSHPNPNAAASAASASAIGPSSSSLRHLLAANTRVAADRNDWQAPHDANASTDDRRSYQQQQLNRSSATTERQRALRKISMIRSDRSFVDSVILTTTPEVSDDTEAEERGGKVGPTRSSASLSHHPHLSSAASLGVRPSTLSSASSWHRSGSKEGRGSGNSHSQFGQHQQPQLPPRGRRGSGTPSPPRHTIRANADGAPPSPSPPRPPRSPRDVQQRLVAEARRRISGERSSSSTANSPPRKEGGPPRLSKEEGREERSDSPFVVVTANASPARPRRAQQGSSSSPRSHPRGARLGNTAAAVHSPNPRKSNPRADGHRPFANGNDNATQHQSPNRQPREGSRQKAEEGRTVLVDVSAVVAVRPYAPLPTLHCTDDAILETASSVGYGFEDEAEALERARVAAEMEGEGEGEEGSAYRAYSAVSSSLSLSPPSSIPDSTGALSPPQAHLRRQPVAATTTATASAQTDESYAGVADSR